MGGGFGGLATVQAVLAKSSGIPIVLIDQSPRFLFKPLLYELLSGELQLWEVAPQYSSLASELGFIFLQERVVEVDEFEQKIITASERELTFSQLVISTGVTTDYSFVEDLKEYAYGFSNLKDLLRLKELITMINNSSKYNNPLVICGAGPTGIELACKVSDLVDNRIEIYLIDQRNEILSKSKSFNRERAIYEIAKRNIKIYLEHQIKYINRDFLEIQFNKSEINKSLKIDYSGLVLTAGLKPAQPELIHKFLDQNNKVNVNKFLQICAYKNIFFVGDVTCSDEYPFPSSAQVAMQQGLSVAQNIIFLRKGEKLKSFEFEDFGEILSLGIGNASITGYGITLAGPLAFEIRRLAYLMRMPSLSISLRSTGSWLLSKQMINRLFSKYP